MKFTSIDPLRIGYKDEDSLPILRIGAKPKALSGEDGVQVALECKILDNHGLFDVHCEIRELEFWGSHASRG